MSTDPRWLVVFPISGGRTVEATVPDDETRDAIVAYYQGAKVTDLRSFLPVSEMRDGK